MKTIIRVEHPADGWGLFRIDKIRRLRTEDSIEIDALNEMYDRHYDLNTPFGDGLNMNLSHKQWFCAYKSIEQIRRWITEDEFKVIIDNEYRVLLLDVNEYQEGQDQIVFTKESIVSMKDISSLFI